MFALGRIIKDQPQPLTFIAEEPNSTIYIDRTGRYHPTKPMYKTSLMTDWEEYREDIIITLTNIGDYVQFKSTEYMSNSTRFYVTFVMTGKIRAEGDIQSLVNYSDICGSYCYYKLFANCTSLIKTPKLTATVLADNCYEQMFDGCTQLSSITVNFTEWSDGTTNNWLNNVNENGIFKCPNSLIEPINRGPSTIPESWTIYKF